MLRRLAMLVVLALGTVAAAAAADTASSNHRERTVAIGDLHGDWDAWLAIARAARLVDERNRWSGGSAKLVQVGDIADRGPDSLKIIRHLRQLQRQARRSGGSVTVLVGNHEAMNVIGDLRYVHPGEYAAFADARSEQRRSVFYERNRPQIEIRYRQQNPALEPAQLRERWLADTPLGWVEHRLAWQPNGEVGRWVAANPAVALIDGNLFVHGGLSAEYASLPLNEINRRVSAAVGRGETEITSIINDPLGPLWYRGNVSRSSAVAEDIALSPTGSAGGAKPRPSIQEELEHVLAAYGARRLIVGHTPVLTGIEILHDGRLVRIDTGISRYYGGKVSYLEIVGGRLIPHSVDVQAERRASR